MTIGPYTVTGGTLIPYVVEVKSGQIITEAADYSVVVVDRPRVRFLNVKIKVSRTEANNIEGYLTAGVRFAATAFDLVDDFGTTWSVRFWGKSVKKKFVASNRVALDLVFRVETLNL